MPSREKADNSNLGYFLLANPRIISPTRAKEPNIVLISIDTLRRDHLSTYGYEKKTSPFLDSLASESAVFNNAIAQAPYTVTSHITMMTSLWPSAHQILTHDHQDRLSTKWLTLPQILKARGYQTAGFTGGGQVSAVYGFDRGMDVYDFEGGRSEVIFPKAKEWITKTQGNPFFLFLHTYDVHMPYEPPPPFDNIFDPEYKGTI
ncbi:MAG: sulfatase-like hydrolase/transferase, partial [Candidatus Aminicenantaceae bacterium]